MASPFSIVKSGDVTSYQFPSFQRWSASLFNNQIITFGIGPINLIQNNPLGTDDPVLILPNVNHLYFEICIYASFFYQIKYITNDYPFKANSTRTGFGVNTGIKINGLIQEYSFTDNKGKLLAENVSEVDFTSLTAWPVIWQSYNTASFPYVALETPSYFGASFNVMIRGYGTN